MLFPKEEEKKPLAGYQADTEEPKPVNIKEFTKAQIDYLEKYICDRSWVEYRETKHYDVIGETPYNEHSIYKFKCSVSPWSNDRIRFLHYGGVKDRLIGKLVDDRKFQLSSKAVTRNLNTNADLPDTEKLNFIRSTIFKQYLNHHYDEALNGLKSYFVLFQTDQGMN